jgi:hypothetical protein
VSEFVTKDSGVREEYASGMRRDTQEGKARYDLIDETFLTRWGELMGRGADKYGEDNWRLAASPEEWRRFRASANRHIRQWSRGEVDEDHAAAVAFNLAAKEYVETRLKEEGWTLEYVLTVPRWTEPTPANLAKWSEIGFTVESPANKFYLGDFYPDHPRYSAEVNLPERSIFFPTVKVNYDVEQAESKEDEDE